MGISEQEGETGEKRKEDFFPPQSPFDRIEAFSFPCLAPSLAALDHSGLRTSIGGGVSPLSTAPDCVPGCVCW